MRFRYDSSSIPRVADGDVRIDVAGRYEPDAIVTRAGRPLKLTFRRHESWPCSDRVVFADFGIEAQLPLHKDVVVELPPQQPGEYEFTCGMQVLTGRLIVEPA